MGVKSPATKSANQTLDSKMLYTVRILGLCWVIKSTKTVTL